MTFRLKHIIRTSGPCISCTTHFLGVRILRDWAEGDTAEDGRIERR